MYNVQCVILYKDMLEYSWHSLTLTNFSTPATGPQPGMVPTTPGRSEL